MKQIFSAFLIVFSFLFSLSQNISEYKDKSMSEKVDSLEREIVFSNLSKDLHFLSNDLKILALRIDVKSLEIKNRIVVGDLDRRYVPIYQSHHNLYNDEKDGCLAVLNSNKEYYGVLRSKHQFTEAQINLLSMLISSCEKSLEGVNFSLEAYQFYLDNF